MTDTHVVDCIHATASIPASLQGRLIWPLNVSPFHASARQFQITNVRDSAFCDAPRSHSKGSHPGENYSSRGTCPTSTLLVGGGSSKCGLLLRPPSLLTGGLGGELWGRSQTAGPQLYHPWSCDLREMRGAAPGWIRLDAQRHLVRETCMISCSI